MDTVLSQFQLWNLGRAADPGSKAATARKQDQQDGPPTGIEQHMRPEKILRNTEKIRLSSVGKCRRKVVAAVREYQYPDTVHKFVHGPMDGSEAFSQL